MPLTAARTSKQNLAILLETPVSVQPPEGLLRLVDLEHSLRGTRQAKDPASLEFEGRMHYETQPYLLQPLLQTRVAAPCLVSVQRALGPEADPEETDSLTRIEPVLAALYGEPGRPGTDVNRGILTPSRRVPPVQHGAPGLLLRSVTRAG